MNPNSNFNMIPGGNRGPSFGQQEQQEQQQHRSHFNLQPVPIFYRPHRRQTLSPRDVLFQTAAQAAGRFARLQAASAQMSGAQVQADIAFIVRLPLTSATFTGYFLQPGGSGGRVDLATLLTATYRDLALGLAAFRRAVSSQTVSPDVLHYLSVGNLAGNGPVNLVMAAAWSAVAYADPSSPVMAAQGALGDSFLPFLPGLPIVFPDAMASLLTAIGWLSQTLDTLIEVIRLSELEVLQLEAMLRQQNVRRQ